jgi:DNA-binding response OmpR family regulator
MRILVVEDEQRLADALGQILSEQKYQADVVYNGTEGLACAESGEYDVVVLDVMLPGMNGFDVVRTLRREKNATPVLLLTARDDVSDKVTGLDCGADDYMTKPFSPEELLARVRALSRRQGAVELEQIEYADLVLRLASCELCCRTKSIRLGYKEFAVMKLLMANPSAVISKDLLISRVWGVESDAEDNNVEAYISFLRKKLSFLGSRVTIGTQRKLGYRLEAGDAQ